MPEMRDKDKKVKYDPVYVDEADMPDILFGEEGYL